MIRSTFKKTMLMVSAISLMTTGAYAADEKGAGENTAPSTATKFVANIAMKTGAVGMAVGAAGLATKYFPHDITHMMPPSASSVLFALAPYAWIVVPGIILASGSALYLREYAKGFWNKIRATVGSSAVVTGGLIVTAGTIGFLCATAARNEAIILNMPEPTPNSAPSTITGFWEQIKDAAIQAVSASKDADWYNKFKDGKIPSIDDYNTRLWVTSFVAAAGGCLSALGCFIQP